MPLSEKYRSKLDTIVMRMEDAGEPDDNIQFVVDDFKNKYGKYPERPKTKKGTSLYTMGLDIPTEGKKTKLSDISKGIDPVVHGLARGMTWGASDVLVPKMMEALQPGKGEKKYEKRKMRLQKESPELVGLGDILSYATGPSKLLAKGLKQAVGKTALKEISEEVVKKGLKETGEEVVKGGFKQALKELTGRGIVESGTAAIKEGTQRLVEEGDIKKAAKTAALSGALGAGGTYITGGIGKGLKKGAKALFESNPIVRKAAAEAPETIAAMKKFKITGDDLRADKAKIDKLRKSTWENVEKEFEKHIRPTKTKVEYEDLNKVIKENRQQNLRKLNRVKNAQKSFNKKRVVKQWIKDLEKQTTGKKVIKRKWTKSGLENEAKKAANLNKKMILADVIGPESKNKQTVMSIEGLLGKKPPVKTIGKVTDPKNINLKKMLPGIKKSLQEDTGLTEKEANSIITEIVEKAKIFGNIENLDVKQFGKVKKVLGKKAKFKAGFQPVDLNKAEGWGKVNKKMVKALRNKLKNTEAAKYLDDYGELVNLEVGAQKALNLEKGKIPVNVMNVMKVLTAMGAYKINPVAGAVTGMALLPPSQQKKILSKSGKALEKIPGRVTGSVLEDLFRGN